jgi:hypothetical protein
MTKKLATLSEVLRITKMRYIISWLLFLVAGCASSGLNYEITTVMNKDLAQNIQGRTVVPFLLNNQLKRLVDKIVASPSINRNEIKYFKSVESRDGLRILMIFKVKNTFDLFVIYVVKKSDSSVIGWYQYNKV